MSNSFRRTSFTFLLTTLPGIPFLPAAVLPVVAPAVACVYFVTPAHCLTDTPTYIPANTTIAILPVVNAAKSKHPDKDAELQAKQAQEGNRSLTEAFGKHSFKLTDPALVTAAMQTCHFDHTNQSSLTSDNLATIGNTVHADVVVLMVITDTRQGFRHGLLILGAQREGEAKTKLWLVDTRTHSAVLDGVLAAGKAQTSTLMGWATNGIGEGSSAYVLKAIDDAVNKSLTDFFKPYPAENNRNTKSFASVAASPVPHPEVAPVRPPAPTVPAPQAAPPPQSLFTFANGSQAVGTLLSFDGSVYTVNTTKGMRKFKVAAVKSISTLPATPVAATVSAK